MSSTDVATVPQQREKDTRPPIVVLRQRLQEREGELKAALPPDISPASFIRAVITAATINTDILGCSWQSVWISVMKACRDGLLPDGIEGAIVPYKSTATWIPMYQGLLRRFRRSGQFKWITAGIVHEGEEFHHYIDQDGEHFRHVPGDDTSKPILKIYALATTRDGGQFVCVIPKAEADKIRSMSRTTREDSPWKLWTSEMYRKTALRRLSKMLPSVRDLMGEDELVELDAPTTAPEGLSIVPVNEPRASGPAAALEQFARDEASASGSPSPPAAEDGGAQDQQHAQQPPEAGSAAADAPAEDPLAVAYARGREAKAAGHQRKALPPEFRDPAKTREALAWQAGHDGGPMPAFKSET